MFTDVNYGWSPIFPQWWKSERNASARENHPTRERRDAVRERECSWFCYYGDANEANLFVSKHEFELEEASSGLPSFRSSEPQAATAVMLKTRRDGLPLTCALDLLSDSKEIRDCSQSRTWAAPRYFFGNEFHISPVIGIDLFQKKIPISSR